MDETSASTASGDVADRTTPPAPVRKTAHRGIAAAWVGLATALLAVVAMVLSYRWSERQGMDRLFEVAAERLELYAGALESELRRVDTLPALLALDDEIAALFDGRADAPTRERASRKLARVNARAGSQLLFATDAEGRLLASSEAATPEQAERWLAIARDLQQRGRGFYAAVRPGAGTDHYRAEPVQRQGRVAGWLVVRVNLAPLEATWVDLGVRTLSERLLVVDDNEVVIMSSVPAWKYRTLNDAAQLPTGGRYPAQAMPTLGLRERSTRLAGAPLVDLAPGAGGGPFVVQERAAAPLGLRFVALSDPADVLRNARSAAWGAGAVVALAGLLLIYFINRQRALRQLFRARNELQAARDDLEHQVAARTAELERQIAQRRQSEDELIQAGKLAVLGQMSAGIAHELNQPLQALRALSGNNLRLLEAGRTDALQSNLRSMGDVVERMGRITSQLKTFARRWTGDTGETSLAAAIGNARMLVEHRIAAEGVRCEVDAEPGLVVKADPGRLEQVLVNLMTNALDAMAGCDERRLAISCRRDGDRVRVRIADSGRGIDEAAFTHLFEPFFTTKPPGEGLGLGLVISSKIVREFGGTLAAERGTPGMIFSFDLAHV